MPPPRARGDERDVADIVGARSRRRAGQGPAGAERDGLAPPRGRRPRRSCSRCCAPQRRDARGGRAPSGRVGRRRREPSPPASAAAAARRSPAAAPGRTRAVPVPSPALLLVHVEQGRARARAARLRRAARPPASWTPSGQRRALLTQRRRSVAHSPAAIDVKPSSRARTARPRSGFAVDDARPSRLAFDVRSAIARRRSRAPAPAADAHRSAVVRSAASVLRHQRDRLAGAGRCRSRRSSPGRS